MIEVTYKRIIPESVIEETFGLIDMGILWRGRSLMVRVPLDLPAHEIDRIKESSARILDVLDLEWRGP